MRKVVREISLGRDDGDTLLHGKPDGAVLSLPDRALNRVVLAVEIPGVCEVAVVRHVEMVGARPHERAHDRLGKEEAIRRSCFDRGQPDVGRDADDAEPIPRGGNGAGGVRPVAVVVLPCRGRGVRAAPDAGDAVCEVDVRSEVRMREVDSGVDITREHRLASACDRLRFEGVDLLHVPLKTRQGVAGGRCGERAVAGPIRIELAVVQARGEARRGGCPVHRCVCPQIGPEVASIGARDRDPDLRVVVDELPARRSDQRCCVAGRGAVLVGDDVGLDRSGRRRMDWRGRNAEHQQRHGRHQRPRAQNDKAKNSSHAQNPPALKPYEMPATSLSTIRVEGKPRIKDAWIWFLSTYSAGRAAGSVRRHDERHSNRV